MHQQNYPMHARPPLRPQKQSKSRQFMRLPNKLLFISTFFNQKIKNGPRQSLGYLTHILPAAPSYRPLKNDPAYHPSPKYELNNSKIHFNFEEFPKPYRKFRKVIKHRSLNRETSQVKEDLITQRMSLERGKKVQVFLGEDDSFVIDTKKSALLGEEHHEIIKKQLQDKFERTRENLKEGREKELHQITNKLDRTHRLLKKITKSQSITKNKMESEQFQPWIRSKVLKDGTVDMQQSANYDEQF